MDPSLTTSALIPGSERHKAAKKAILSCVCLCVFVYVSVVLFSVSVPCCPDLFCVGMCEI